MATSTALMTFEEFLALPQPKDAGFYELRRGELVLMTRPKKRHGLVQQRVERLLIPFADHLGFLSMEVCFRALPEHEFRVADVAWVSQSRFDAVDDDGYITGAPELVIEVVSESNTPDELKDKKLLCLANGCEEFWIIYPKLNLVEVSTAAGSKDYQLGDTIRMCVFPGAELSVSAIFS